MKKVGGWEDRGRWGKAEERREKIRGDRGQKGKEGDIGKGSEEGVGIEGGV